MSRYQPYPAYKDSGVEWLGEVPEHWVNTRFKFLTSITTGGKDTENKEPEGKYPFYVRSKNVERINSYSFDGEAILTAGDGDIGKIFHYVNGKFDYHQRVYMFYKFNGATGHFLYYYLLENLHKEVIKLSAKTTVDSLRLPMLQNFVVSVPKLSEQTTIANFLDRETTKIDTLIDKQQQLITLLKEKRQAVISHAVTKGLDPNVKMKDSEVEWLGEVPEGWKVKKTKYFFSLIINPAPKDNDYELLSIYTDIGVRPRKDLEQKGNKSSTTDGYWMVKKGDLIVNKLLAWMGAIGHSAYSGVTSPAYDILRGNIHTNSMFYHYLFRTKIAQQEFKRWSRGIMEMRLRLYFSELGNIFMPVPPLEEQNKIVQYITDFELKTEKLMDKANQAISLLEERRTALISAAVTGKIDVRGEVV